MKHLTILLLAMTCIAHAHAQIQGTVYIIEDPAAAEQQFIEKLKTVSANEQLLAIVRATEPARRPAAGAVVTARSLHKTQTAVTDAAGHYSLPVGAEDEVSARMPDTNLTSASQVVYGSRNRLPDLALRNDMITIRGKVTDADGRPVTGAAVVAEPAPGVDSEYTRPNRVSTTTAEDGTYELAGIEPPHLWKMAGYLNGGTGGDGFMTVVTITAPGMKRQSISVPPITESRLPRALQLHQALAEMSKRAGGKQEIREKEGLYLPNSSGNDILDVNFALKPE